MKGQTPQIIINQDLQLKTSARIRWKRIKVQFYVTCVPDESTLKATMRILPIIKKIKTNLLPWHSSPCANEIPFSAFNCNELVVIHGLEVITLNVLKNK